MKNGSLRVWWIPQVPGKAFKIPVNSVEEVGLLLDVLAAYDAFQFENNIKPDYSNMGGLEVWQNDSDGEGTPGWMDWEDNGETFDEWRESNLPERYDEIMEASK
jgi:hypothetical protein